MVAGGIEDYLCTIVSVQSVVATIERVTSVGVLLVVCDRFVSVWVSEVGREHDECPFLESVVIVISVPIVSVSNDFGEINWKLVMMLLFGVKLLHSCCVTGWLIGGWIDKLFFQCPALFIYGGSKYGEFAVNVQGRVEDEVLV